MKNPTLCALIQVAMLLSFAAAPGFAESAGTATVSMRPYKGGRAVVAVKVNGAGPYDFMVDTGATITVLDTALFDELGLRAEGSSRISSTTGATNQVRSIVKEITLDGLSAQDITVVSMKSPMTAPEYRAVRGILGENFLRHFDILFDNRHRRVTLDATDGLADSLAGERMSMTFPSMPQVEENKYRPMLVVKVRAYGTASMLLDSGATDLVLLQRGKESDGSADTRLTTVNGTMGCESASETVYFSKGTVRDFPMVICRTDAAKPRDKDGIVPTAIFNQVFISHAGSYAIINPTKRSGGLREIASVRPLAQ